jgi:hypothetical protein
MIVIDASAMVEALVGRQVDDELLTPPAWWAEALLDL